MQYLKTIHGEYLNVAQMMQITLAGQQASIWTTYLHPADMDGREDIQIVLVACRSGQYLHVANCWILSYHATIEEAQANLTRIMDEIVNGKQVIEC